MLNKHLVSQLFVMIEIIDYSVVSLPLFDGVKRLETSQDLKNV